MSQPVLLLFGYGPRTGKLVADRFASVGYRVAVTGRSLEDGPVNENFLKIKADLVDPTVVAQVYKKTTDYFQQAPSVVVYLAYAIAMATAGPLTLSISQIQSTLTTNITSLYAAAAEAVKGFVTLPPSASSTFVFVGNKQSHGGIWPSLVTLGIGKAAGAYIVGCAAEGEKGKGYKFYYVDQRTEEGEPVMGAVDGEAHGEYLLQLAEAKEQGPWEATFVKGKGYVAFPRLGGL